MMQFSILTLQPGVRDSMLDKQHVPIPYINMLHYDRVDDLHVLPYHTMLAHHAMRHS
jgi:hypothetical protein